MLHLPAERLAALADSEPAPAEVAHLAVCPECTREWKAFRSLRLLAQRERMQVGAPVTDWETLAPRLRAEGVSADVPARVRSIARHRAWLQAAAAVVLLGVGAAAGRLSVTADPDVTPGAQVQTAGPESSGFASTEAALAALAAAEQEFQTAAAYLVANDTISQLGNAESYRTRLAALDEVGAAMQRALDAAPYDPVINRYYLTTLGAREATLRQLNSILPTGVRLNRF